MAELAAAVVHTMSMASSCVVVVLLPTIVQTGLLVVVSSLSWRERPCGVVCVKWSGSVGGVIFGGSLPSLVHPGQSLWTCHPGSAQARTAAADTHTGWLWAVPASCLSVCLECLEVGAISCHARLTRVCWHMFIVCAVWALAQAERLDVGWAVSQPASAEWRVATAALAQPIGSCIVRACACVHVCAGQVRPPLALLRHRAPVLPHPSPPPSISHTHGIPLHQARDLLLAVLNKAQMQGFPTHACLLCCSHSSQLCVTHMHSSPCNLLWCLAC